jgi:hypothetical protein
MVLPRALCCSRRKPFDDEEKSVKAWRRLTKGLRRLARLRRIWAHLGRFLSEIKARRRA